MAADPDYAAFISYSRAVDGRLAPRLQSAVAVRDRRLDGALTQAVQAWRTDHTSQARDALLAALKAVPRVVAMVPIRPAEGAVFSADGRRAALQSFEAGTITVHDLADGRTVAAPLKVVGAYIALDGPGTRLAVGREDGRMFIRDLASGRRRSVGGPARRVPGFQKCSRSGCPPNAAATSPSFAPGGRRLAWSPSPSTAWSPCADSARVSSSRGGWSVRTRSWSRRSIDPASGSCRATSAAASGCGGRTTAARVRR